MQAGSFFSRNRVLLIAIGVAFASHLVWLTVFTIVAPRTHSPVRFSRVAFLGPVLERGAMEVRMSPRERTFLENRYLDMMARSAAPDGSAPAAVLPENAASPADARLTDLIVSAVAGTKLEPPQEIE